MHTYGCDAGVHAVKACECALLQGTCKTLRDVLRDPSIWDLAWDSYQYSPAADGEGLGTLRCGLPHRL